MPSRAYFVHLSLLLYRNIHTHSCLCFHLSTCVCVCVCCVFFICLCARVCICVVPFQVALTCSMHPTVRPKRTSQSLTACALPPLSPLVLTHVFVSLLTPESVLLLFFSVSKITPRLQTRNVSAGGNRHAHVSSFVCKHHQT